MIFLDIHKQQKRFDFATSWCIELGFQLWPGPILLIEELHQHDRIVGIRIDLSSLATHRDVKLLAQKRFDLIRQAKKAADITTVSFNQLVKLNLGNTPTLPTLPFLKLDERRSAMRMHLCKLLYEHWQTVDALFVDKAGHLAPFPRSL